MERLVAGEPAQMQIRVEEPECGDPSKVVETGRIRRRPTFT